MSTFVACYYSSRPYLTAAAVCFVPRRADPTVSREGHLKHPDAQQDSCKCDQLERWLYPLPYELGVTHGPERPRLVENLD